MGLEVEESEGECGVGEVVFGAAGEGAEVAGGGEPGL